MPASCRHHVVVLVETSLVGLSNAWDLAKLLGHLKVVPEGRKRLTGPVPEFRTVAALGITLEQRHRVLVSTHLVGVEVRTKILAVGNSALTLPELTRPFKSVLVLV